MTQEQRINYFRKGLSGPAVQLLWVMNDCSRDGVTWVPDDVCELSGLAFGDVMNALTELQSANVVGDYVTENGLFICKLLQ